MSQSPDAIEVEEDDEADADELEEEAIEVQETDDEPAEQPAAKTETRTIVPFFSARATGDARIRVRAGWLYRDSGDVHSTVVDDNIPLAESELSLATARQWYHRQVQQINQRRAEEEGEDDEDGG